MIKNRPTNWSFLVRILVVSTVLGSVIFLGYGNLGRSTERLEGSVPGQATGSTERGSNSQPGESSLDAQGSSAPTTFSQNNSVKPNGSSETPTSSSPLQNSTSTTTDLTGDVKSSTDSTIEIPISCRVYVNPIGSPANYSFRLIITSETNFTAKVSINWTKKTVPLTVDILNGSGSAIIKGDQLIQPKVSVSSQSDANTELCTNRNS